MQLLLVILVCFVVYILAQYARSKWYVRVGERLAAQAIPFSQQRSHPSFRILVAGDSTGVGTGASSPSASLAGLVGARYPSAEVVNVAVNGSRTADVVRQLEAASSGFDLVMLHVGGNDTVRFTDLVQLELDVQKLLTLAIRKGRYVLVTSTGNVGTAPLFPLTVRYLLQGRTHKTREIFLRCIAAQTQNVRYTDLYRDAKHDPFAQDPSIYYAADLFHPSDAGYRDWFACMSKELDQFSL